MKLFFILIILSGSVKAQYFNNPSLEADPAYNTVPGDWYTDAESPDIGPIGNELTRRPYNGNSYVHIYRGRPDYMEMIGQVLTVPLDSGKTYTFTIEIASVIAGVKGVGIYGKNTTKPDEQRVLLWGSGTYKEDGWTKVRAYITPSQTIKVLVFFPYLPESEKNVKMDLLIDDISDITQTFKLDMTGDYLCTPSDTGSVSALASGSKSFTYLWEPGGYTTATVHGLSGGMYKVTITDEKGIVRKDSVDLKVADVKTGYSVYPISCHGKDDGSLQIVATGGQSPYTFTLNDITQDSSIFYHLSPGNYTMNVTDRNGCADIEKYPVIEDIDSLILKSIEARPVSCSDVTDGQITLNVTGGTPPYFFSILDNKPQVENIFPSLDKGSYNYKIDDRHHCFIEGNATITKEYRVCAVYVPSAFSPNGDGLNEVFRIRLQESVTSYRMAVYGRWGEVLFESNDPYASWDGKLHGIAVPAGNYVWMATYTDSKKQLIKQQGRLTIIR